MRTALALVALAPAIAAASPALTYQGRVLDPAGGPLEGPHSLVVTLYDHGDATSPTNRLWQATYTPRLANGYYSVVLDTSDSGADLDPDWFAGDVWVGIAIDGAPELQPRQALTSVARSIAADTTRRVRIEPATGSCEDGEVVWDTALGNLSVCVDDVWRSVGNATLTIIDGARSWTNGNFATSCNEYRNPSPPALYEGAVGDGLYRIDPDGAGGAAPFDVHCDMTTDGGGWTLLGTIAGGDANRWNHQYGPWSDASTIGSAASPHNVDHKSAAWNTLDVSGSEVMFERWYAGSRRAQSALANSCLHGVDHFVDLFTSNNNGLRCGRGNIRLLTEASSTAGVASSSYQEGVGSDGLGGSRTNGFCWNGGDNNSNTFRGHAGWNQSDYSTCVASGHLGYIGVWQTGSSQFTTSDITGTNWLFGTDYSQTAVSLYAR